MPHEVMSRDRIPASSLGKCPVIPDRKPLCECPVLPYSGTMITTFKHKGLKAFYTSGSTRGIQSAHAARLLRMLSNLDVAASSVDMDLPGYRLHPLKGDLAGFWSISVSGNWRVIFRFSGSDVELLDYLDYH